MKRIGRVVRLLLLLFVVASTSALVTVCWCHGAWTWSQWRVYLAMADKCHPVWRDFQLRRIRAGDPVDEVILRTNPVSVEHIGRWTILKYHEHPDDGLCFTGLTAAAYDGRMVAAFA